MRTHDGSVYRGELVERVTGDHVTLRVVTGSLRRIAWREVEIDPAPPPPEIPVVETVRTTDGSVYRGEIVEKVIGDHVAVKTATGAIRFVLWRELDTQPAHDPSGDDAPQPAALTVHTGDGSVYHGEIVEKVNGDHVTLKIATGALRRIEWSDIDANPKPRARMPLERDAVRTQDGNLYQGEIVEEVKDDHVALKLATGEIKRIDWDDILKTTSPAPVTDTLIFEADQTEATLQQVFASGYVDVCSAPCDERSNVPSGHYRIAGKGLIPTKSFPLQRGQPQHLYASMPLSGQQSVGSALTITSIPFMSRRLITPPRGFGGGSEPR